VFFHVHARFTKGNAFRFEEFALQTGVRLADQQLSAIANHAVPRNAFPGGACRHRSAGAARSAPQTESFGKAPIGNNPPAGNSFHERENRSPGHVLCLSPFATSGILHKQLPSYVKKFVAGFAPDERVETTGGVLNGHEAKISKHASRGKRMASTKQMKRSRKSDEKMRQKNANLQSITFKTLFYSVWHLMVDDVVEGQYTTRHGFIELKNLQNLW